MMKALTRPIRKWLERVAAMAVMASILVQPAHADEITLQGIPLPGIEVLGVQGGKITYLAPNGAESATALSEIGGLQIDAHPEYARAVGLLEQGKWAEAVPLLREVFRAAGKDAGWVRQFAAWRLTQACDAAGRGAEAVSAFIDLVGTDPDPYFLNNLRIVSATTLEGPARENALALLRRAARSRNTSDAARAAVEAMLTELTANEARGGTNDENDTAAPPTSTPPADPTGLLNPESVAAEDSLVVLPATLRNSDEASVNLLRAGRFREAITLIDSELRNDPGRLQQRLYLRAVAQLGLAEDTDRRDAYLDAGLGFMRVVAMARSSSAYLGPSLLETAYIHRKVGEPAVAAKLFEEAGLLLDPDDEPAYHQRYLDLIAR